jgi:hypothetical protein
MEHRDRRRADVAAQRLAVSAAAPGRISRSPRRRCRLRHDPPGDLESLDQLLRIVFVAEKLERDPRRRVGIVRAATRPIRATAAASARRTC